jgi:hypothetical protein
LAFFTKSKVAFDCIFQSLRLFLTFDQILSLEMGISFFSSDRWFPLLAFFTFFLGWSLPGYSFEFQDDSLYEKVNRNEWIRKADSTFVSKDDYKGAEKLYLITLATLGDSRDELRTFCMIKLGNIYTSSTEYVKAKDLFSKSALE